MPSQCKSPQYGSTLAPHQICCTFPWSRRVVSGTACKLRQSSLASEGKSISWIVLSSNNTRHVHHSARSFDPVCQTGSPKRFSSKLGSRPFAGTQARRKAAASRYLFIRVLFTARGQGTYFQERTDPAPR